MAEPAINSQGTLLQIGDGATPTEAFTTIVGCGDLTGPGTTRDTQDVTSHTSTGGYREFITTLRDGGEVSCDIYWVFDASQTLLEDAFDSNASVNFQIVFTDAGNTTYGFAGLVTDLSFSAPVEGALTRSLTLKVTGPVTEVP
jgi:predicted secreted protein